MTLWEIAMGGCKLSVVVAALALCGVARGGGVGGEITANFQEAGLDRWMYPFNDTRGYRTTASVFGALGQEFSFPPLSFDQRDAQFLVGFDTASMIPVVGAGCGYRVTAARLSLTVASDLAFVYDPTYDSFTTYPIGDLDPGRPVELYGAAFRNGWQSCPLDPGTPALNQFPCFFEGTPQNPGPAFGPSISFGVRNVYPTDFVGPDVRDVSNNVREGFDPVPFAVGQMTGVNPGALVPVDSVMTFDLDVNAPSVQAYLREAAASGMIRLVVTSLQPASSGGGGGPGSGSFATFYCKEIGIPEFSAQFSITVAPLVTGDADGSGTVAFPDITAVLANWGTAGPVGDANCDGMVSFPDITTVLANWGAGS